MKKIILSLLLVPGITFAADLYHYQLNDGCVLKRFDKKAWQVVDASEVGTENFAIQTSKVNGEYSNFKFKNNWYAAKTSCFELSPEMAAGTGADTISAPAGSGNGMKKGGFFFEPKFSFFVMTGAAGATSQVGNTNIFTTDKYSPSVGIAGKFGYYLNAQNALFAEIGYFSASQPTISNSTFVGTLNDKIVSFNLGYQHFFLSHGSFTPFVAIALGYNSLTGTVTYNATQSISYSASGVGAYIEGGTHYTLSEHISAVGSLTYTFMGFNPTIANNSAVGIAGASFPTNSGYGHIGINVGARYNF
jgi:hypothetical protein